MGPRPCMESGFVDVRMCRAFMGKSIHALALTHHVPPPTLSGSSSSRAGHERRCRLDLFGWRGHQDEHTSANAARDRKQPLAPLYRHSSSIDFDGDMEPSAPEFHHETEFFGSAPSFYNQDLGPSAPEFTPTTQGACFLYTDGPSAPLNEYDYDHNQGHDQGLAIATEFEEDCVVALLEQDEGFECVMKGEG